MRHRVVNWLNAAVPGVAALILVGCATPGSQADKGYFPLVDSESALSYERSEWSEPFWERWVDEARAEARATARAEVAAAQSAPTPAPVVSPAPRLRPKVGVIIENGDSPAAYRLVNALERNAAEHGLMVINPGVLADALGERASCSGATLTACRQALAVYPGTRALLVLQVQSASGDAVAVQTQLIDADFGIGYDSETTRLSLSPASGRGSEVAVWSDRVLDLAASRIAIAPWFTHSFAREGDDVYVSAGRRSGLDAGTVLAVHEGGSLVRAPGGQIVGWNPGPVVGRLKVKQLIGQRIAVAETVSGRMPRPQDKITVAD